MQHMRADHCGQSHELFGSLREAARSHSLANDFDAKECVHWKPIFANEFARPPRYIWYSQDAAVTESSHRLRVYASVILYTLQLFELCGTTTLDIAVDYRTELH